MKKFTSFLTVVLLALMSITFTSCDEDSNIAYTLDGTWKGNMYVEYGNYNATYTVIRFDQNDGFYSGTGYWIDYYQKNYWHGNNYIANRINWTVRNGNIYIDLLDERSSVVIYDYALSDRKFSGYVDASNGNRAYFEMYRDSYGYNWRDYDWGYDWGYDKFDSSLGIGSVQQSRAAASDTVDTVKVAEKPERKFVVK